MNAVARNSRQRGRAILRMATALTLLSLLAVPLARAATSPLRGNAHHCCPDGAPATDPSVPCQFSVPFACCGQAGVPEAAVDHAPTANLLAPLALEILVAPLAPPRLRELASAPAHQPIPPLLQTSVLLL